MSEPFGHLIPAARKALALPINERIAYMQKDRWIKYQRAEAILHMMERIFRQPPSTRPPCLMVFGAPNNGKTHLIRKFHKDHPPIDDPEDGKVKVPVLLIEDLNGPDERRLYNSIIQTLGFPNKPNDPIAKLEYKAHRILIHYEVKVLVIDEFNTFVGGSPVKQRQILDTLKTLSTRRKISIIGAGTAAAFSLMQLDTQFSSRFTPAPLPAWEMDIAWRTLLASFERVIPLSEPSGLSEPRFAQRLLAESDATIGDAWDLLELMAVHAIENGASRLHIDMIAKVGWIKPSERVRYAQATMSRVGL